MDIQIPDVYSKRLHVTLDEHEFDALLFTLQKKCKSIWLFDVKSIFKIWPFFDLNQPVPVYAFR